MAVKLNAKVADLMRQADQEIAPSESLIIIRMG